jgi:Raf kinase inhibitor-like YbhB/YbcL family protein
MSTRVFLALGIVSLASTACAKSDKSASVDTTSTSVNTTSTQSSSTTSNTTTSFTITSPAFTANAPIAAKYTCEGDNTSPPLAWSGAPANTRTFALIVEDPDAPDPAKPTRVVTHWVLYNIPAGTTSLAENAAKGGLPGGAAQGANERKAPTYMGPCPPIGTHRYFFKLSALDTTLTGLQNPSKAQVETAIQGHVIDSTQVIGTYEKTKK